MRAMHNKCFKAEGRLLFKHIAHNLTYFEFTNVNSVRIGGIRCVWLSFLLNQSFTNIARLL